MRGCFLLVVGFVVGAALVMLSWPRTPQPATVPQQYDVQILVRYAYIARRVQESLPADAPQITNLQVGDAAGALVAAGHAALGPVDVPVSIEAMPVANNGQIRIQVIAARLGGIPVPGVLIEGVTAGLGKSLQTSVPGAQVQVVRVLPAGVQIFADYTG